MRICATTQLICALSIIMHDYLFITHFICAFYSYAHLYYYCAYHALNLYMIKSIKYYAADIIDNDENAQLPIISSSCNKCAKYPF